MDVRDEPDRRPRQDPDVPQALSGDDLLGLARLHHRADHRQQRLGRRATAWSDYDPAELVTGEHSGLRTLPQQPVDNPFLAPALRDAGVRDAGLRRLPRARRRGPSARPRTVPRHPMNVYYNTATYQEQVDEYDWYYTSRADGGGGVCEDNPATSTCITPLPTATEAEARASFEGYIVPLEVRNALRDRPRPTTRGRSTATSPTWPRTACCTRCSTACSTQYAAVHDTATTPLVTLDLTAPVRGAGPDDGLAGRRRHATTA